MSHGVELRDCHLQEGAGDVTAALGLRDGSEEERLVLFQLPPVLPAPLSTRAPAVKLEHGRQLKGRDDAAELAPADKALSLQQLPPGRVRNCHSP